MSSYFHTLVLVVSSFCVQLFIVENGMQANSQLREYFEGVIKSNSENTESSYTFRGREYVIKPNVFSPTFFKNTHWFNEAFVNNMPEVESFLEIGTAAGNVISQAFIQKKFRWGVGSDVVPEAVECAAENFKRHNINAQAVVSDVLDQINKEWKFDLIYWSWPYVNPNYLGKEHKDMTPLEKTVFDPDYMLLNKLLKDAKSFLKEGGFIILSFSLEIGMVDRLSEICSTHGWVWSLLVERPADKSKNLNQLCLIKVVPDNTK